MIEHIKNFGPVSYSEYMELCLYRFCDSYYRAQNPVGFHADFFTSPYLHPVFGSLIAVELFIMWDRLGKPDSFDIVELGAGDGTLAIDILDYVQHISNDFYDVVKYSCVEIRTSIREHGDTHRGKIKFTDAQTVFNDPIYGCVLSNEFFDALPVHRVVRTEGGLHEIMVDWQGSELIEVYVPLTNLEVANYIETWSINIPEGYIVEINTIAESMLNDASRMLKKGFVLTIDYGDISDQLYGVSSRQYGTIRSFKNNVQIANVLNNPGSQDITSHVNFTVLIEKGIQQCLHLEEFISQRKFLLDLGCGMMLKKLEESDLDRRTYILNKRRIDNLLDEKGLGDFKVLIQSKGHLDPNQVSIQGLYERLKVPIFNT